MADLSWLPSTHMPLEVAEKEFSEVLGLRKSTLGEVHPDTLNSQTSKAWVYYQRGRWKAAEAVIPMYNSSDRESLVLKNTLISFIQTIHGIATMLYYEREPRKAEELYRKAYDLRHDKFGEEHPKTLAALSSLSTLLSEQGRHQKAEASIGKTPIAIKKTSNFFFLNSYQLGILRAEVYLRRENGTSSEAQSSNIEPTSKISWRDPSRHTFNESKIS